MRDLLDILRQHPDDKVALIDAATGETVSYGQLAHEAASPLTADGQALILAVIDHDIGGVGVLLRALAAGHVLMPLGGRPSVEALAAIEQHYRPDWIVAPAVAALDLAAPIDLGRDYLAARRHGGAVAHADLRLLLPTSGSLGSPRTVKLGVKGLAASLRQVGATLAPNPADRVLLTLPFVHVYGLTTLLSHLAAGASILLSRESILSPVFGALCDHWRPTTLGGVAFTFDVMRRIGWRRLGATSLRTLTHSGDRLPLETAQWAARLWAEEGVAFHRMYGMTETTGRISVLAPAELADHPGSVGHVVPEGRVEIVDGEVFYDGPNVMGGYARGAADLVDFERSSPLATGDLGHLDAEGRLYLTGRRKLIAKVLGVRVGLEDLEEAIAPISPAAAIAGEDRIVLHLEAKASPAVLARIAEIAAQLRIPRSALDVRFDQRLPRTPAGKLMRAALAP
jgi:acyl-CoA synthetase (AMP-forming)/AMP-acid ligase II